MLVMAMKTKPGKAKKRRSGGAPKVTPADLGTEETRAKLRLAPWGDDPQLVQAADAIRTAVCLLAGGTLVSAQDMLHVRHHGLVGEDVERARAALLRRYTWWRWEVAGKGWVVGELLDVIVHGQPLPEKRIDQSTTVSGTADWIKVALAIFTDAPRHAG